MPLLTNKSTISLPGNGSSTTFDFDFVVWDESQLEIWVSIDGGDPAEITSNFTVALNADQDANPGGTVTYPVSGAPLTVNDIVIIRRGMPFTQEVDLRQGRAFNAEIVETALNKATAERQQLKEEIDRAAKVSPGQSTEGYLEDCEAARTQAQNYAAEAELFIVNGMPATKVTLDTSNFNNNLSSADDTLQKMADTLDDMSAGGGGATYTGTAERTIGGITEDDAFTAATMTEMWDQLIKEEKYPTLTAPSSTFDSDYEGYREVGEIIGTITFTANFSRGSISPQYTATSPYRSGLPNQYIYTGTGLSNQASTSLSDVQTITSYTVVANGQSWTCSVAYDAGVQPKSSYDNDYSTPLSADSTTEDTETITGVLPLYATDTTIGTLTKQSLRANGSVFTVTVVAESGSDKQTVDFPNDAVLAWGTITKLEQYNTLSGSWDEISLSTFTSSATTHTIQGTSRDYARYTHNGATTGARQLRWTV